MILEPAIGTDKVSGVTARLVPPPVDEEDALPFMVLGIRESRSFPFPLVENPKMFQIELSSGRGVEDVFPGDEGPFSFSTRSWSARLVVLRDGPEDEDALPMRSYFDLNCKSMWIHLSPVSAVAYARTS